MFQGKNKAITFSYDDGVTQDRRLIELFGRYGLKATFNLNSGLLGGYNRVPQQDVAALYAGHEIAAHTLTHPDLLKLGDEAVFREVEEDRLRLSELAGYTVIGMAYPYGTSDSRVVEAVGAVAKGFYFLLAAAGSAVVLFALSIAVVCASTNAAYFAG